MAGLAVRLSASYRSGGALASRAVAIGARSWTVLVNGRAGIA
jgi:hypothetical protein